MFQRGGESRADRLSSATGNRRCFPVHTGYGGCREVLSLWDCEGGVARSRGWCEALRALLRERCAGGCTGDWAGVKGTLIQIMERQKRRYLYCKTLYKSKHENLSKL